jgi:hypothetical protein
VIAWALSVLHTLLGWANMAIAFRAFNEGMLSLAAMNFVVAVVAATAAGIYAADAVDAWTI